MIEDVTQWLTIFTQRPTTENTMQKTQDEQEVLGLGRVFQPVAQATQNSAAKTAADLQDKLQTSGLAAAPQKSGLQVRLDGMQAKAAAKAMDGAKGKALKQKGLAAATVSKNAEVEAARRIARTLAANGPISIDDVTEELVKNGREKSVHDRADKARVWKGAIFRTSEWIKVHEEQARLARSRSRPVAMWALRSWIEKNSLNGTQMHQSKFDLDGLRRDFERANPKIPKDHCHWFVGTSRLADSVATDIKAAGNSYQGVPVTFVPYAVGAILQYAPPQIGKHVQQAVQVPPTTFGSLDQK